MAHPGARTVRNRLFALLDVLGATRFFLTDEPRILLYHGVSDERGIGIFNYRSKFIPTAAFKQQLAWFKKRFVILPLAEFVERHQKGTLPPYALSLTFDDGYENNYTAAYSILRKAGVPATFFITTDFVESHMPLPVDVIEHALGLTRLTTLAVNMANGPKQFSLKNRAERIRADLALRSHMKTLSPARARELIANIARQCGHDLHTDIGHTAYRAMTWEQMREMEEGGMTFAPHTRTHPILSRCSLEEAQEEIIGSKTALEKNLTRPLPVFAYPNGGKSDYTDGVKHMVQEAGYGASFTTDSRVVRKADDIYALPRFTMDGTTDIHRARLVVSGMYQKLII